MAHPFCDRLRRRPPLLYGILDTGLVRHLEMTEIVELGETWARQGVDLIQLRGKQMGAGPMLELVGRLHPLLQDRGVPLLVNDRVDVALLGGADGVHLGQEDMTARSARELLGPDRLIGWSTHDPQELADAPPQADYLGFGAIYPTKTRQNSRIRGPEALTETQAATTLPIFAIGGIDAENLVSLGAYRIAGVAVASALLRGSSTRKAVAHLRQALEHWS